ncbi:MAG: hypothetical protein KKF62_00205 [Bacteroidetes bacterium]|nr:hypothetical protein [Bacteroidota bacterium]MBU1114638.1 hypothetical protein [Bacteroidota bacterium]MBU1798182.1 hypothetical protein [Bacteroidota bacterium]
MIKKVVIILSLIFSASFAQSNVDIFIIDSYVTPELPHKIKITFFTSDSVKSKIKFDGNSEILISQNFIDEHNFEMLYETLKHDSTSIPFQIIAEDKKGNISKSDKFDLALPGEYNIEITNNSNFIDLCFGGIIYLIPSPTLVFSGTESKFSLNKEIPLIAFYNGGYNYPSGYISLEYSHIFNLADNNYLRAGYKQIIQTKIIKYISPGINVTTNFNGFNGISPEISFGLFNFYETFTLYARYRYNYGLDNSSVDFQEISIGLFTSAISFNY